MRTERGSKSSKETDTNNAKTVGYLEPQRVYVDVQQRGIHEARHRDVRNDIAPFILLHLTREPARVPLRREFAVHG